MSVTARQRGEISSIHIHDGWNNLTLWQFSIPHLYLWGLERWQLSCTLCCVNLLVTIIMPTLLSGAQDISIWQQLMFSMLSIAAWIVRQRNYSRPPPHTYNSFHFLGKKGEEGSNLLNILFRVTMIVLCCKCGIGKGSFS